MLTTLITLKVHCDEWHIIGVRTEARRPYGMKSNFVKGQLQLFEPFRRP
jgi:hypothetical protein